MNSDMERSAVHGRCYVHVPVVVEEAERERDTDKNSAPCTKRNPAKDSLGWAGQLVE